MTTRTFALGLLLAGLLLASGAVFANNVAYVFTLNWQSGALLGSQSQGSFSFDEAMALPNAQYLGPNSLNSFSLSVGNRIYGLSDVTTGFLSFDASSDLRLLGVGTNCGPGFCEASPTNEASFFIVYDSQSQLDRFFAVAGPPDSDQSYAVGVLQLAPVPEPSSLMIVLAGAGLLALRRRTTANPSIARMPSGRRRLPTAAAHVDR